MRFNGFGGAENTSNKPIGIQKSSQQQKPNIDPEFRQKLIQTLKQRLVESGWKAKVGNKCEEIIQQYGVENIDLNMLIDNVTPFARHAIPDDIKRELLFQIQEYLEDNM